MGFCLNRRKSSTYLVSPCILAVYMFSGRIMVFRSNQRHEFVLHGVLKVMIPNKRSRSNPNIRGYPSNWKSYLNLNADSVAYRYLSPDACFGFGVWEGVLLVMSCSAESAEWRILFMHIRDLLMRVICCMLRFKEIVIV
jgi:hypothetical protein